MNFSNKEYYRKIASETLDVINKGYYINGNGEMVEIRELVNRAVQNTELINEYNGKDEKSCTDIIVPPKSSNLISVINDTTINTIIGLREKGAKGNIIALNFASAKNPGGGFQTGANAQEESIARASALYPCLIRQNEFYEFHRRQGSPLYSDRMIYSPDVPIFRDDNGNLLSKPILCSFITSPAVNAKVLIEREIKECEINERMRIRIAKILDLAIGKHPEVIILGAFGCGVFGNKPEAVAQIFSLVLNRRTEVMSNIKTVFAIYDKSGEIVNIFSNALK